MRVLGVDLGKQRDNPAVCGMTIEPDNVLAIDLMRRLKLGIPYDQQTAVIGKLSQDRHRIGVDLGGVGAPVVDYLWSYGIPVYGVLSTGGKTVYIDHDERRISIPKRGMVEHFALLIEKGKIRLDDETDGEEFERQLEAFERKGNKLEARTGHHDDMIAAAMIAALMARLDVYEAVSDEQRNGAQNA